MFWFTNQKEQNRKINKSLVMTVAFRNELEAITEKEIGLD